MCISSLRLFSLQVKKAGMAGYQARLLIPPPPPPPPPPFSTRLLASGLVLSHAGNQYWSVYPNLIGM